MRNILGSRYSKISVKRKIILKLSATINRGKHRFYSESNPICIGATSRIGNLEPSESQKVLLSKITGVRCIVLKNE